MRILYTNFHEGYGGGHTTYVLNLFNYLRQSHEVHIAAPRTSDLSRYAKLIDASAVLDINFPKPKQWIQLLKEAYRLRKQIIKNRYSIIHVNGSPDRRLVAIACIGLRPSIRIVYTKHNSLPLSRNWLSFNRRRYCSTIDHIILVCQCEKEIFTKLGVSERRLSVIANGIDVDYFAPAIGNRSLLGFSEDDFILVSNAGTAIYKGWHYLVEAVRRLNNPKIKIVILGALPREEDKIQYVGPSGFSENVIFPGVHKDPRPYIALGDVGFVLSYQVETISFACREMLSMGKPVIVSDYACLPENIREGETGFCVPVGDVDALVKLVDHLSQHRSLLNSMGRQAREWAVDHANLQKFALQTEAVYTNLVAIKSSHFI